jgi:hypothetical protein
MTDGQRGKATLSTISLHDKAAAQQLNSAAPACTRILIHGVPGPRSQRVDFRSRSVFALFDWGKNRFRMQELEVCFEQ